MQLHDRRHNHVNLLVIRPWRARVNLCPITAIPPSSFQPHDFGVCGAIHHARCSYSTPPSIPEIQWAGTWALGRVRRLNTFPAAHATDAPAGGRTPDTRAGALQQRRVRLLKLPNYLALSVLHIISGEARLIKNGSESQLLLPRLLGLRLRLPSPPASRKMGVRLMFMFLLSLSISWIHSDAKSLETSEPAVLKVHGTEGSVLSENIKNEDICTLCEQFTTQAVEYLSDNKTETEIIASLHHACSQLHMLKDQCTLLVDYYASLFFMEIGLIRPEDFCAKVDLCQKKASVHLRNREDPCSVCQRTVAEVLTKLKDPDTQLEIIQTLIKACNKVEHFSQQCKKLIFEYGPVILINAEKFLETTNVCAAIHACRAPKKLMFAQSSLDLVSSSDA